MLFPAENCISHSQHSLVAFSSFLRLQGLYPICFGMSIGVILVYCMFGGHVGKTLAVYWSHPCSSHVWGHVGETSLVQLLVLLEDKISQQTPSSSGLYNLSTSTSTVFAESKIWECLTDVSIGTGVTFFEIFLSHLFFFWKLCL